MAGELSSLGDIRIEYLAFIPSIWEKLGFSKFDVPKESIKSSAKEKANHIIFWINEAKILEFWKGGTLLGVIHNRAYDGDFEKLEGILMTYGWLTKRTATIPATDAFSLRGANSLIFGIIGGLLSIFYFWFYVYSNIFGRYYFTTFGGGYMKFLGWIFDILFFLFVACVSLSNIFFYFKFRRIS